MDRVVPFGCCGFEHGEPHWENLDRVVCMGKNPWTFLVVSGGGPRLNGRRRGVGRVLGADTRGDEGGVRLAGEGLLS